MSDKTFYSDNVYWNEYWKSENRQEEVFLFAELFEKNIVAPKGASYMEVGGAPGSIMSYMYKKYSFSVSTIDFCDREIISAFLDSAGVKDYEIFSNDFCEFDVNVHSRKYDVVSSWGVVEHFSLDMAAKIIDKQKKMVKKGGYIIVELPNIRFFNWLLYYFMNKDLLAIHNLNVMDLAFLREEVQKDGFEIVYGDYYLTSLFQYNQTNAYLQKHTSILKLFKMANSIMKKLKINDIPNRLFSPYIVFIAQRK